MEATSQSSAPADGAGQRVREVLGDAALRKMYEDMLRIRRFEERAGRAYQQGKIKGFATTADFVKFALSPAK